MSTVLDSLVAGALADQKEREQAVPFEELKDRVRCADWTDEDYVDCVSKEALKVAIEALEREVSTNPDRV